jgi:spore coat protein U-like protein
MSKSSAARLLAAVLLIALSPLSFAQGTGSITVSAAVSGVCRFTATPDMTFAAIDPSGTAAATQTSTIKYKCTKGTTGGTFQVGGTSTSPYSGTLTGISASPETMAYSISWTGPASFTGEGFGAAAAENSVTLTGSIAATAYSAVKADTYRQVVALTIAP